MKEKHRFYNCGLSEKLLYTAFLLLISIGYLMALAIGLIFRFATVGEWFKASLMLLSFVAIVTNILSWFFTKWDPFYAHAVIAPVCCSARHEQARC